MAPALQHTFCRCSLLHPAPLAAAPLYAPPTLPVTASLQLHLDATGLAATTSLTQVWGSHGVRTWGCDIAVSCVDTSRVDDTIWGLCVRIAVVRHFGEQQPLFERGSATIGACGCVRGAAWFLVSCPECVRCRSRRAARGRESTFPRLIARSLAGSCESAVLLQRRAVHDVAVLDKGRHECAGAAGPPPRARCCTTSAH